MSHPLSNILSIAVLLLGLQAEFAVTAELHPKPALQRDNGKYLILPSRLPGASPGNIQGKTSPQSSPAIPDNQFSGKQVPGKNISQKSTQENSSSRDTSEFLKVAPLVTSGSKDKSSLDPQKKGKNQESSQNTSISTTKKKQIKSLFNRVQAPLLETGRSGLPSEGPDDLISKKTPLSISQTAPDTILLSTGVSERTYQDILALTKQYKLTLGKSFLLESLGIRVTSLSGFTDISDTIEKIGSQHPGFTLQPDNVFSTLSEPLNHLQLLHREFELDSLHEILNGEGVVIAVIDTGVAATHQDLQSSITVTENFVDDSPYHEEMHGTAVAGLLTAEKNNIGISGIAPKAQIVALRACLQEEENVPAGKCFSSSIARALDYSILKKADIINMSLGAVVDDPLLSRLIEKAKEKQMLLVAPAGNISSQTRLAFPASHPLVIAVAGVDREGRLIPNKKIAKLTNLCFPSTHLFTTLPGNRYNFMSGTSLSTAIASGLLALSIEKYGRSQNKKLPPFSTDYCAWAEALLQTSLCLQEKN